MSGRLTKRQREVLLLVANGNSSHRIASWLGIELSGVHSTLRRVYRELGVASQPQAVAVALRVGELRLEDIREPVGGATESYPPVSNLTLSNPSSGPGGPTRPERLPEHGYTSEKRQK